MEGCSALDFLAGLTRKYSKHVAVELAKFSILEQTQYETVEADKTKPPAAGRRKLHTRHLLDAPRLTDSDILTDTDMVRSGADIPLLDKRRYLLSLSVGELVRIVERLELSNPRIPIYANRIDPESAAAARKRKLNGLAFGTYVAQRQKQQQQKDVPSAMVRSEAVVENPDKTSKTATSAQEISEQNADQSEAQNNTPALPSVLSQSSAPSVFAGSHALPPLSSMNNFNLNANRPAHSPSLGNALLSNNLQTHRASTSANPDQSEAHSDDANFLELLRHANQPNINERNHVPSVLDNDQARSMEWINSLPPANSNASQTHSLPEIHVQDDQQMTDVQHSHEDNLSPSKQDSHFMQSDMPTFEEMIVQSLQTLESAKGVSFRGATPKQIFDWMDVAYPYLGTFRQSAHQVLQKCHRSGRLTKADGHLYRCVSNWTGGVTSNRRPNSIITGEDSGIIVLKSVIGVLALDDPMSATTPRILAQALLDHQKHIQSVAPSLFSQMDSRGARKFLTNLHLLKEKLHLHPEEVFSAAPDPMEGTSTNPYHSKFESSYPTSMQYTSSFARIIDRPRKHSQHSGDQLLPRKRKRKPKAPTGRPRGRPKKLPTDEHGASKKALGIKDVGRNRKTPVPTPLPSVHEGMIPTDMSIPYDENSMMPSVSHTESYSNAPSPVENSEDDNSQYASSESDGEEDLNNLESIMNPDTQRLFAALEHHNKNIRPEVMAAAGTVNTGNSDSEDIELEDDGSIGGASDKEGPAVQPAPPTRRLRSSSRDPQASSKSPSKLSPSRQLLAVTHEET